MIRIGLTELLLFVAPFALYAVFLVATRAGTLDPKAWPLRHVLGLSIAALVLVIGSFIYLAQFSGPPVGTTYVPAHVENGRLVPGAYK